MVPIVPVASGEADDERWHQTLRPACTVEAVGVVETRMVDGERGIEVVGEGLPEVRVDLSERTTRDGFRWLERATIRSLRAGLTGVVGADRLHLHLTRGLRRGERSLVIDAGLRRLELRPRGLPGAGRARVRRDDERRALARLSPRRATIAADADPAEVAVVVFLAAMEAERLVAVPITPVMGHHVGQFFEEGFGELLVEGLIRLVVNACAAVLEGL